MKKQITIVLGILCVSLAHDTQASIGIEVKTKVLGLHSEYTVVGVMKRLGAEIKGIIVEAINAKTGEVDFIIPQGQSFDFKAVEKSIYHAGFCMSDDDIMLAGTGMVKSNGNSFTLHIENSQSVIGFDANDKDLATKLAHAAQTNGVVSFNVKTHFDAKSNRFSVLHVVSFEVAPSDKTPEKK